MSLLFLIEKLWLFWRGEIFYLKKMFFIQLSSGSRNIQRKLVLHNSVHFFTFTIRNGHLVKYSSRTQLYRQIALIVRTNIPRYMSYDDGSSLDQRDRTYTRTKTLNNIVACLQTDPLRRCNTTDCPQKMFTITIDLGLTK